MNKKWIAPAAIIAVVGGAAVASQTGLLSSPTGTVAENDLNRSIAECEMYAYEQAGIPVSADDPERKKYSVVKSTAIGTAAGAGVGAVGGEVVGDKAGKGAIVGAIVGGAAGYLKSRSDKEEYKDEVGDQAAQLEAFEIAANSCMTAKGY